MTRPARAVASALLLLALLTPLLDVRGDGLEMTISFAFPDGSVKSTVVTGREVDELTGESIHYYLLPWVEVALRKLELLYSSDPDAEGFRLTAIAGVANGPEGEWVYSVNGFLSPYRLDSQLSDDVKRIAFKYRKKKAA